MKISIIMVYLSKWIYEFLICISPIMYCAYSLMKHINESIRNSLMGKRSRRNACKTSLFNNIDEAIESSLVFTRNITSISVASFVKEMLGLIIKVTQATREERREKRD